MSSTDSIKYKVKRLNVSPEYISELRPIFKMREYRKPIKYKNNSRYLNLRTLYDEERKVIVHENWNQIMKK